MAKLLVGPFNEGLRKDKLPFLIDNDSFPVLVNAYQWRGRVLRKRGTELLNRLQRYLGTTDGAGNLVVTISPQPIASGIITVTIDTDIFVDGGGASPVALTTNSGGSATLNRATGVLTIAGSLANTDVLYNPSLPVMGIEELRINPNEAPGTLAFDTDYAYNISQLNPYPITDVSFYKNPLTATYTNYVQKTTWDPIWWNGQDYQQFWTTNFAGALWATNGITVPFNINNIGMHYNTITNVTIAGGPPPTATITTGSNHGLVIGDFVFINEVSGITGLNFQTGYVTAVGAVNQITVTFPNATLAGVYTNGGIVQYLTNRLDTTIDCITYYDGDPTNGAIPPTFVPGNGWVNYCPPLSQNSFSIGDLPQGQYYLVGARVIVPYKDRLLFFGPVVQTSAAGSQVYLQDTVIYTQNGTPYYTCSYTNSPAAGVDTPTSITNVFNPILVPENQTATSPAVFNDQIGFGGFISAGVDQMITTVGSNEDALIVGFFNSLQARLVSTGNDLTPFEFYQINSELSSTSTFSQIQMDRGVITRGDRGFIITSQVASQRIDLAIPDQVFEVNLDNNGTERFTAARDFINEWVYFTYNSNDRSWTYPNQTLFYNYRDQSWAIFNESYTTYGPFQRQSGETWATLSYDSWEEWTTPWQAGDTQNFLPLILGGNQQGFILFKNNGTEEDTSLAIQDITGSTVTSPNHNLNNGDYIFITAVNGAVGTNVNNKIFSVANADDNTFDLVPNITAAAYTGSGFIKRFYVPFIQTKQFPLGWDMSKKTRIGPQKYLFTKTDNGQVSIAIFLSQDSANPYNDGPLFPNVNAENDSLIYSQIVYTCPESTNLGLTPPNTNLQQLVYPGAAANDPAASGSARIWHRMNTSLLGDTVQIGLTLSDDQMRDTTLSNQFAEIEFHGFIMDVTPAGDLA